MVVAREHRSSLGNQDQWLKKSSSLPLNEDGDFLIMLKNKFQHIYILQSQRRNICFCYVFRFLVYANKLSSSGRKNESLPIKLIFLWTGVER